MTRTSFFPLSPTPPSGATIGHVPPAHEGVTTTTTTSQAIQSRRAFRRAGKWNLGLLGWLFDWFWYYFEWLWGLKIHPKSIKNRSQKWSKRRCDFECNLEGSWADFWWIFAPKWRCWGVLGPSSGCLGGCWRALGEVLAPRWPQGGPIWVSRAKNGVRH